MTACPAQGRISGFFVPMFGAARLEADNIVEYEILAQLAFHAGELELIDPLLHLAEVEWDHELQLGTFASGCWQWRFLPEWPVPGPRAQIRARFDAFRAHPQPVVRRTSWLVR